MNKLINKYIIYFIAIVVLFAIPIYTVIVNIAPLKDGTEYLFKVQAFDPYDMFRGNYLTIRFEENSVTPKSLLIDDNKNNKYYVTIGVDKEGFAYFDDISISKPENTSNYYETEVSRISYMNTYYITTPTKYYMNENKSSKAEQLYRENIDNTYVKVKVKNGKMDIIGVYINDVLIDSIA